MIFCFFVFLCSLGFRECRPNLLLQRQFAKLVRETGITSLKFENPDLAPSWQACVREALTRPVHLFFTEPIVAICSIRKGVAFALIYGLTEALTIVYVSFGFSDAASSLSYISILIGILLCTFNRVYDQRTLQKLTIKDLEDLPEVKMRSFLVSAPVLAVGL